MAMKCFWCGKELVDNGVGHFPCPYCGAEIKAGRGRPSKQDAASSEWFGRKKDDDGRNDATLLSLNPPKHLKVETAIDGAWPVTIITFKRFDFRVLFLVPFTCVWAGTPTWWVCTKIIADGTFNLKEILCCLPFSIGGVVLAVVCLFMMFGKRRLELSGGNGRYFIGIGPVGRTVNFKYDRSTEVENCGSLYLSSKRDANTIRICSGFSNDALSYTAAILRRECKRV